MNQKGQTLVSLLIIIAVTILAVASAIVSASLSSTTAITTISDKVYYSAETGAEEALIKLLRDPSYPGETLGLAGINVEITVSSPSPTEKVITSIASTNSIKRRVDVSVQFLNNILTVTSWDEMIP
ncbi:hypothetical protein IID23_03005 [Patescibacteria group bacterium]|nr:hypothetical protein [Patescibacteria group bacterium]